jgi:hypothetical protein
VERYHLLSAAQILESATQPLTIRQIYDDELAECMPVGRGEGCLDDGIDPDVPCGKRLHFSDCMDPDSYAVIAAGFEEYLQTLIEGGYAFASE